MLYGKRPSESVFSDGLCIALSAARPEIHSSAFFWGGDDIGTWICHIGEKIIRCLARRTKLPVRAWLQRPVSFDEGKRSQALKHYTNYGLNGDAVDAIWFLASREDTQKYMDDIQNAGGRLHRERDKFLLHTPGLYMGAMASGNSLFLLGLAAENTAQKHQLFGWETDSGFYLGRLSQAVGLN